MEVMHYLLLIFLFIISSICEEERSKLVCPAPCSCSKIQNGHELYIVNCSSTGLVEVPNSVPVASVEMHLSHNHLKVVPNLTFTMFDLLKKLYLDHNEITQVEYESFGKDNHPGLNYMDLSFNKMEGIPRNLPRSLRTLQLSNNQINSFSATSLLDLPKLQELHLDHNYLTGLHKADLHCHDNPGCDKYRFLPGLHKISLSFNQISEIEDGVFGKLPWLESLSLAHNNLTTISKDTFKDLKHLHFLDLSHNRISYIHPDAFASLEDLKFLYLSHNLLASLPAKLNTLEWLDISHNQFTTLPEEAKTVIYPVEIFIFSHNPLHCDCDMLWLKELYDRREYILKHIKVKPEEFIPHCATPPALANETWDNIGDEVFNCKEKQSEGANKRDIPEADYKVMLSLADVTTTSMTVHWSFANSEKTFYRVFVQYYVFGQRDKTMKYTQAKSAIGYHSISGLQPATNYIVCVIPAFNEASLVKVSLDSCIEAVTTEEAISIIDDYMKPVGFSIFYGLAAFISLFSFIGLASLVYGIISMKTGSWSSEYVNIEEEKKQETTTHESSPPGDKEHKE